MAENLGTGVSTVIDEAGRNHSMVVFQKGKPPLDTEMNLIQQIQNIINQKQMSGLPSGWLSLREVYTSLSRSNLPTSDPTNLQNKFYTQDPSNAIPEYALVNGNVVYVTNTSTTEPNSNIIDLGTPPSSGNKVNGIYLEVWRSLLDTANNNNKPIPAQIIDSIMDIDMVDSNFGWAVGENGLILGTQNGGLTWNVEIINTKQKLNGVFFYSSNIGWVVGDDGVIAKTSTGGSSWVLLQNTLQDNLNSVYFSSQLVGYSVGNSGVILKTTNGVTFIPQISGTIRNLNGVYFYDTLTGWAVGDNGTILKTTNGGSTWNIINSNVTTNLKAVQFYDLNYGWAVGDSGTILRTSDSGLSWVSQSTGVNDLLDISIAPTLDVNLIDEEVSSQFTGSNKNFTVPHYPITNGNGKAETTNNPSDVSVTVNGVNALVDSVNGANGAVVLNVAPSYGSVVKITYWTICGSGSFSGNVWISGKSGTVLFSDNIGSTWTLQTTVNTTYDLNGICFINKSRGWTAGGFSTIRVTADSGTTWTVQQSSVVVREVQKIYNEGNIGTTTYLTDDSIHPDVNIETTKRVQIQYKIRVADNVDPLAYPDAGLGSSVVVGLGPNNTGNFTFENMGVSTGDYGLWMAQCSGTVDGYCWAIPMFFVNRRNSNPYNLSNNTNGSNASGSVRPDLLVATNIVSDDVLDIRRKVILPPVSELLEENFDSLLSNNLNTRLVRNTSGGDRYGTSLLQTDSIGGTGGGDAIPTTSSTPIADAASTNGGISSEVIEGTAFNYITDTSTISTIPINLTSNPCPPTGFFSLNTSLYSAKYVSTSNFNGKPIPGYFSGFGTNSVVFTFSSSANNIIDDPGLSGGGYLISGPWVNSTLSSLKYIPTDPKLVINTRSGSDPFYYHGVLDTETNKVIEQWDSGVSSYINLSEVYPATFNTDTDQQNRASTVLVKFYMKVSLTTSPDQNTLIINKTLTLSNAVNTDSYNIWSIHQIKNVTSNFTYKIGNISGTTTTSWTVTSLTGFSFLTDNIIEITAAVTSGTNNIRNGASVNFTPNIKKIGSFCKSYIPTPRTITALTYTIPLGTGESLLGVSTTETNLGLTQPYCIINDGVKDHLFAVSVTGWGLNNPITISSTSVDGTTTLQIGLGWTLSIQVLVNQTSLSYSNSSNQDGLYISYYYNPYQSVSELPTTLELEMVTKPSSMYISNLGTGGGNSGDPYMNPLNNIPVSDNSITNEGYFYNLDSFRFNNFKVSSGFVEMPINVPGSFGRSLTLSVPKTDSLQRTYYSSVSSDFTFETEALSISIPRKMFISCIGIIKSSSDNRLIKGEYVLVIFSRHTLQDNNNYTGFVNGGDTVASIYRLPNRPTFRG